MLSKTKPDKFYPTGFKDNVAHRKTYNEIHSKNKFVKDVPAYVNQTLYQPLDQAASSAFE